MVKLLRSWSKERDPNYKTTKKFMQCPSIELKDWTEAYNWFKEANKIIKLKVDEVDTCFVGNKDNIISKNDCKEYITNSNTKFEDLNKYLKYIQSIKVVIINENDWKNSTCSCGYWQKNFICKHVITVAVNLNFCVFPAVNLKIEGNRRRGRPGKVAKALEKDKINIASKIDVDVDESDVANKEEHSKKKQKKNKANQENIQETPIEKRTARSSAKSTQK